VRTGGGGYRNNTTLAAACMHEAVAMLIRIEAAPGFAGFADPDVADDSGVTPLHVASMFGLYDIVKFLLSYGRINVNVRDEGGRTPLHKAATGCRSKVVWLLLINGADPNARDSIGHTPLHGAVYRQGTDAVHKGECKVITPLFSASPFPLLHGWDQGIAEVAHLNQPFFQK